jgi:two-component system response regulator AtoC
MPTNEPREFFLVVLSGPDAGARARIEGSPLSVGRALEANLRLTDPTVSREHVTVTRRGERVEIEVCKGAAPLLHQGHAREQLIADVGSWWSIGNTVLQITEEARRVAPARAAQSTVNALLLGGVGSEIRGLAAIFNLSERCSTAPDRETVERVVSEWGATHLACDSVEWLRVDRPVPGQDPLVELSDAEAVTIVAPVDASRQSRVAFKFRRTATEMNDGVRRILLVAASLVSATVERIAARSIVEEDRASLRQMAVGSERRFLGDSPAAEHVAAVLPKLASSGATALILGETGVGKSYVARLIHENGPRAERPLRVICCAAIPENLVESELFGHERGSFSGAVATKIGAFEAAGDGTLFLDEIGELPLSVQAKLLRAIDDRQFERVGGLRPIPLRARILAATNRDLEAMRDAATFRPDLYFRLSVITLRIPPLRERGDDLLALAHQIVRDLAAHAGRRITGISPEALEAIRRYPWPGNVRELRNVLEHAIVMGETPVLQLSDLPQFLSLPAAVATPSGSNVLQLPAPLDVVEARAIEAAIEASGGNLTRAAALLGISRQTLYNRRK